MGRQLFVFVACGAISAAAGIGCGPKVSAVATTQGVAPVASIPAVPPPTEAKAEVKRYTREEFKALVVGKTKDEVIAAVGKPDQTMEDKTAEYWYYDRRTFDPVSQKGDSRAQVVFKNGAVHHVNF